MGNSQQKQSPNRENQQHQEIKEEEEEDIVEGIFTCEICIEPMSTNNKLFKNKNLCRHPFCEDCIAKYIEAKVEDNNNNTAKIKCPGLHCEQLLDPFACKSMIPNSVFSKWCDALCNDYVLGFERIYCPNRDCMALVVSECDERRRDNGRRRVKKARCPNCKQWFCFQCKTEWHAGYRCEESGDLLLRRNPDDVMFRKLVEEMTWATCPACGRCVEKIEGCDLISCRCKTLFCYKCGRYPLECLCKEKCHIYCDYYCAILILFVTGWLIVACSYL